MERKYNRNAVVNRMRDQIREAHRGPFPSWDVERLMNGELPIGDLSRLIKLRDRLDKYRPVKRSRMFA
jgi:hypothetical protein